MVARVRRGQDIVQGLGHLLARGVHQLGAGVGQSCHGRFEKFGTTSRDGRTAEDSVP